jgi:hypothetical protein
LGKEKALLEMMADLPTGFQQVEVDSDVVQRMGEGQFEQEDVEMMLGKEVKKWR